MVFTNIGLVEYAKSMVGLPYWYGTYGQIANEKLYEEKKRQYPSQYPPKKWTKESFSCQYEKKVHDCAGLIKGYLMTPHDSDKYPYNPAVYNSKYDVSANGMIELCKEQGKYSIIPNVPGLIVWKNGHVGVYIGDGKTIEAKGHAYGVVETTDTKWVRWGKLPWIDYEAIPDKEFCTPSLPVLKNGMNGVEVQRMQFIFVGLQFKDQFGEELKPDGNFGSRTEYVVKQFQELFGLPKTGVVDKTTWEYLIQKK